jgi:hypothetical protein
MVSDGLHCHDWTSPCIWTRKLLQIVHIGTECEADEAVK